MRRRARLAALALVLACAGGATADEAALDLDRLGVARTDDATPADAIAPRLLPAPARSARHVIPLAGGGKHLVVHGSFNRRLSGPMLIDTGASYCVLTPETARRLGLIPRGRRAIAIATANGQVDAELVQLESVQIDDARLARVEAVVMDAVEPPLVGIIGLSFLNHFRYSIDAAEGWLQLER